MVRVYGGICVVIVELVVVVDEVDVRLFVYWK